MKQRSKRLYRVIVTKGSAEILLGADGENEIYSYVYPGRSRTYQSKRAANARAGFWREAGCEVRIDESDVVTWPDFDAGVAFRAAQ